jgi:predicted ester cyclase
MSLEENKAIIRRYTEACNKQNLALLEELVAPDYFHSALQLQDRKEYKQFETMLWKAFPDLHETNEDFIAEGDKVCYRIKLWGHTKANFVGFPTLLARR